MIFVVGDVHAEFFCLKRKLNKILMEEDSAVIQVRDCCPMNDEKAKVLTYMQKHGKWSIRDQPILTSQKRTCMVLRRLERQGTHNIRSHHVVISSSPTEIKYVTEWRLHN
jgi:hypothetical protein